MKLFMAAMALYSCAPEMPDATPPSVRDRVNTATYSYGDMGPALAAFRAVADSRGWPAEQIASWETAVTDIVLLESGGCPNVRRGARLASAAGCVIRRQGRGSDAGFGQLISRYHHGRGQWACVDLGVCGANAVIASPWTSMEVLVALIERDGVKPWCYSKWARRYHRTACNNPGIDVEYVGRVTW